MSEINTPICTHCGHPKSSHRTRELSCPVYGRSGDLQGWSFHSFTTDPPPEPKLYTAAEMKAARLETVERVMRIIEEAHAEHPIEGSYNEDARYNYPDREDAVENGLKKLKEEINES